MVDYLADSEFACRITSMEIANLTLKTEFVPIGIFDYIEFIVTFRIAELTSSKSKMDGFKNRFMYQYSAADLQQSVMMV